MKIVSREEAYTSIWEAVIRRAILDATDISAKPEMKAEARQWLIDDIPLLLAATKPMDADDIVACRKDIERWVLLGCPQDGKFGLFR